MILSKNSSIGLMSHHKKKKKNSRFIWLLRLTITMSLFSPSNASKFITRTILPLERIVQELIHSENQTQRSCRDCSGWQQ